MASKPKTDKTTTKVATPKMGAKKEAIAKTGDLKKNAAPAKSEKPPAAPKAPRDPNAPATGVVDRSKYDYTTTKEVKTASGRASVDNADPLATALRGKSHTDVIALVKSNGGDPSEKWAKLNPGLARMAAGNTLRKLAKRSEGIKIDGKKIAIAA